MPSIYRLPAAHQQPGHEVPAAPRHADRRDDRGHKAGWSGARLGAIILPVLLIVLAVAAMGLGPATAQLCAKLEDFPCGP